MYRKLKRRLFKLTLKSTPSERLRDEIIRGGVQAAEKSGYLAGNTTEILLKLMSKIDTAIGAAGAAESAGSIGRIAYKTTADIAKGDTVCTGLCLASGACETIAFACSTVTIIPFRGKIYIGAKCISRGCMNFRNLCAGEGC